MKKLLALLALSIGLVLSLASATGTDAEPFDSDADTATDSGHSEVDAGSSQSDATQTGNDAASGVDTAPPPGQDAGTAATDAAGSSTCTLDNIFFDSPEVCDTGSFCGVGEGYVASCLPDSAAAGGSFYGACGSNGECPEGSMCAGPSGGESSCAPFCSESHSTCPDNGTCAYSITDAPQIKVCAASDACDPVLDTGCGDGHCYVTGPDANMCIDTPGTATEGESCTYVNDCVPGLLCTGTCMAMCNLGNDADCESGTCQSVDHPSYGVCAG